MIPLRCFAYKQGLLIALFLIVGGNGIAQNLSNLSCEEAKHQFSAGKAAVASPSEEWYDVQYVKIDLAMSNANTSISGSVATTATARQSMNQYVFELNQVYTVDSVRLNGAPVTLTTAGYIRTATLPTNLNTGQQFTAQVWYHGAYSATGNGGAMNRVSSLWGNRATFTHAEPYGARDWWPCKQALQDKIDSSDVWITVPDTLMAGSNGRLTHVTTLSGNRKRYEWSSRYPIDYYLISVAVAGYIDYSYYVHFSGSTDSMLVQNFIYNNPNTLSAFKPRIDSVGLELDYFSQLFGRYPFWKEKYGHCLAPLTGAQENQTMTTITNFDEYYGLVPPHELSHHWWGDHVTCATWQDIWLNEGFASYCEYLFSEHFRGKAAASAHMAVMHYGTSGVTTLTNGSVYVDDTTTSGRIFDNRLSYYKGASVVHMLRYLAPNDSTFFAALRAYQQHFSFRTATTDSFRMIIEPFYKPSLDTFFNEWIYGQGFPQYSLRWNQFGGNTFVSLRQGGSYPSVTPIFHLPVEVRLSSTLGDTTVTIWMSDTTGYIAFAWNHPVSSLTVDPSDWIPHITGSIIHDPAVGIISVSYSNLIVAPNPSHNQWKVSGVTTGQWTLYDVTGRMLRKGTIAQPVIASDLTPGTYMLQVDEAGKKAFARLVRD